MQVYFHWPHKKHYDDVEEDDDDEMTLLMNAYGNIGCDEFSFCWLWILFCFRWRFCRNLCLLCVLIKTRRKGDWRKRIRQWVVKEVHLISSMTFRNIRYMTSTMTIYLFLQSRKDRKKESTCSIGNRKRWLMNVLS